MTMMTAIFLTLGLSISGPSVPADQKKPAPTLPETAIARAGWLTGCWHLAGEKGNPSIRLYWTKASNDLLVGTWIRLPIGLEPEYSFFRIESAPVLTLIWQAPGEAPVRLPVDPAAASSSSAIAFVNPGPGFPKRVEFSRKGDALLLQALYEGTKALETPMRNCS
jgi:hypothetical protein